MSIWSNPAIVQALNSIERSDFYQQAVRESERQELKPGEKPVSHTLWSGITSLHHQYHTAKGALVGQMMRSPSEMRDPQQIERLRDLEIKTAFVGALYYLTHENDNTRKMAERRVRNVIEGRLQTTPGATLGRQFRLMLEHGMDQRTQARVNITNDMN
jgi:hypothetical protein